MVDFEISFPIIKIFVMKIIIWFSLKDHYPAKSMNSIIYAYPRDTDHSVVRAKGAGSGAGWSWTKGWKMGDISNNVNSNNLNF